MKYLIIISCILLSFSSCQDMDLTPKDDLSDPLFWKTPNDFVLELNNLYDSSMETFSSGKTDCDSDIAFGLGYNDVSNGSWIASENDNDWNNLYAYLRQSNMIIEKAESYPGDPKEIERYVAEARFFRAYHHWLLMRKFNSVPIIKRVLTVDSEELTAKRNSQTEVEDFILSELEDIYKQLPLQKELKAEENGRITQGAALALKARVALFAGTWAKYHQHRQDYQQLLDQAITAAEQIRTSGQYALYEGSGDNSYRYLFIDAGDNSQEDILSNRYYKDIRTHGTASQIAWGWWGTPTKKLAEMYLCKSTGLPINNPNSGFKGYKKIEDEFADRDPRMAQTFIIPGRTYDNNEQHGLTCSPGFTIRPETRTGYKLWKFMGEIIAGSDKAEYDYHIFRYAEVLLVLAEATFEKDGRISDDLLNQTINVVRGRKGVEMPRLTNAFVMANGLDMQTEIRRERTIELAFEGFRRDDIRRWKTAKEELEQPIKGINYRGTEYEELEALNQGNPGLVDEDGFLIVEQQANRRFEDPKHYYYPLPLSQLIINPNLKPNNPGWY